MPRLQTFRLQEADIRAFLFLSFMFLLPRDPNKDWKVKLERNHFLGGFSLIVGQAVPDWAIAGGQTLVVYLPKNYYSCVSCQELLAQCMN